MVNEQVRKNLRQGDQARRRIYTSLTDWEIDNCTFEKMLIKPNEQIAQVMKWSPLETEKGCILMGRVGTGKSMLCKALINRWAGPNYRAIFISAGDLGDKLRSTFAKDAESNIETEIRRYEEVGLLVIDDLGTEKLTEFVYDKLFRIFETRIRFRKHTWFTTNLRPNEIESKYGDRIADRIRGNCLQLIFRGDSYRGKV